jgi:hypothetical protein
MADTRHAPAVPQAARGHDTGPSALTAMSDRATARVVGSLFIVATVAGILAGAVQQPLIDPTDYLSTLSTHQSRLATGALLEVVMGVAVAGIVVALYPLLRRYSERLALGFAIGRTIEVVTYATSVVGLLTVLSVSSDFVAAGAPEGSALGPLAQALLDGREWSTYTVQMIAFSLSAVLLNALLFRTRLVPRWLAGWGLVGAVLFLAVGPWVMFGLAPFSTGQVLMVAPLAVQEMVFAVWLIAKGFATGR